MSVLMLPLPTEDNTEGKNENLYGPNASHKINSRIKTHYNQQRRRRGNKQTKSRMGRAIGSLTSATIAWNLKRTRLLSRGVQSVSNFGRQARCIVM